MQHGPALPRRGAGPLHEGQRVGRGVERGLAAFEDAEHVGWQRGAGLQQRPFGVSRIPAGRDGVLQVHDVVVEEGSHPLQRTGGGVEFERHEAHGSDSAGAASAAQCAGYQFSRSWAR